MNQLNELTKIEDRLFFIVGCGRSGTTLFKTILNAHKQIFVPPETLFFTGVANNLDSGRSTLDSKLEVMASKWWLNDMGVKPELLPQYLGSRQPTWANLFLAMCVLLARGSTASRFGEKTVGHIRYAERLLEVYPACRVIQIVRDPRAVYASFRSTPVGSSLISRCIRDWKYAVGVHRSLKNHPRYLQIRFEDLIGSTDMVLENVCQFLDLEYDREMLNFHDRFDLGFSPEQSHHQNTLKPIFTDGLEKWRTKLQGWHVSLIEKYLGSQMDEFGYQHAGSLALAPRFSMLVSTCMEPLERLFVLKPRQMRKTFRANRRLARNQKGKATS